MIVSITLTHLLLFSIFHPTNHIDWQFATAVFPFVHHEYDWSLKRSYALFLFMGAGSVVGFGIFTALRGRRGDLRVVSTSLVLCVIAHLFLYRYTGVQSTWQPYAAGCSLAAAFCLISTLIPAVIAHMVGVKVENLSVRMGWFFMTSCVANALGPVSGAAFVGRVGSSTSVGIQLIGVIGTVVGVLLLVAVRSLSIQKQ